jgi:hypothetical protein
MAQQVQVQETRLRVAHSAPTQRVATLRERARELGRPVIRAD